MKIAILGPAYPYRGGIAAFSDRLALGFQDQGHDVTVYTFTVQYPNILFPGKTQYSTEAGPDNIKIVRCINSTNPINWIKTGNKLRKERPDLVIIQYWLPFMGPCFGTILRRIKKNKHSKVISLLHNIIPHESRPGDRLFTKYFIKPIDAFFALSQSVIEDLNQFDKTKPRMLSPHPLFDNFGQQISKSEALAHLKLDAQYQYILFFGFVRKYKGLDLLLEAFADPRFKDSNIRLIIAGEYYDKKEMYQSLIEKHSLKDKIIQADRFIADSEVKYFFNACDLVVQPYRSATQSGVTQIAYHFNKPMIVTDVGGLAEICPDGKVGFVVNIDVEEISNAIFKFFNETDQDAMIENIMEEKKKYSWNLFIKQMFNLVEKI